MDFETLEFMKSFDETYITKEDLLKLYKFLSLDGKIALQNFENLKNSLYVTVYKFKNSDIDRLATRDEVSKAVFGVYYTKESILDYYKTRYIHILLDYITSGKTYITDINKEKLIQVYEYMFTDSFKLDLTLIKNSQTIKFSVEKSKVIGELTKNVLNTIKKELDPDYGTRYSKMAFNIANIALKNKNYLLSKSQFDCISIEYSKILKNNLSKQNIDFEILDLAKDLKKNIQVNSSYDNLILDICNQVISKKFISSKQKELLLNYKNKNSLCDNLKEEHIRDTEVVYEADELDNGLPSFNGLQWR